MEAILQFVKDSIQEPEGLRRVLFTVLKVGMVFLTAFILAGWMGWDRLPAVDVSYDYDAIFGMVKYAVAAVALVLASWKINEVLVGLWEGVFGFLLVRVISRKPEPKKGDNTTLEILLEGYGFLRQEKTGKLLPGRRAQLLPRILEGLRVATRDWNADVLHDLFAMEVAGLCILSLIQIHSLHEVFVPPVVVGILVVFAVLAVLFASFLLYLLVLIHRNLSELEILAKYLATWHILEETATLAYKDRIILDDNDDYPFVYQFHYGDPVVSVTRVFPVVFVGASEFAFPAVNHGQIERYFSLGDSYLFISPEPLHERVLEQFKPYEPNIFLRVVETAEDAKRVLGEVIWAVESHASGMDAQGSLAPGADGFGGLAERLDQVMDLIDEED